MAEYRITFDDDRSESIRDALRELAEKAEQLTDDETARASVMEKERDEAIEERDALRAQVENLEAARAELADRVSALEAEIARRDEMLAGLETTGAEALT